MSTANLGRTRINWQNFTKLRDEDTSNIVAAKCKNCKTIICTVSEKRLAVHRNSCKATKNSSNNRQFIPGENSNAESTFYMEEDDFSNMGVEEDAGEIRQLIDKSITKFFFMCNIPFVTAEKSYFMQFINTIIHYARKNTNFVYKPPCRTTIATSLLKDLHDEIQNEKKEMLKNTKCVLLAGSWKNALTNENLLVFKISNFRSSNLFLTCEEVSNQQETEDTFLDHFNSAIKLAKDLYETEVVALLTDLDTKIVTSASLVKTTDDKPLILASCTNENANMLLQIIADEEFLKKICKITKAFSELRYENLLIEFGGSKMKKLTGVLKLGNFKDTCESVYKNVDLMKRISQIETIELDAGVSETVQSEEFKNELDEKYKILTSICELTDKCLDQSFKIADATEFWLNIAQKNEKYTDFIENIICPVGLAANYLHHKFRGLLLNEQQIGIAEKFFNDHLDFQGLQELELFIANRNSHDFLATHCNDPLAFWGLLKYNYQDLVEFARSILMIPASTGKTKGLFLQWAHVTNNHGSRLGSLSMPQLIDIFNYLISKSSTCYEKPKKKL